MQCGVDGSTCWANIFQGGYNLRSISKSALAVTKTLMGDPPDRLHSTSPSEVAASTVRRVMMIQSHYWRCMFPKGPENQNAWTDRLHGKSGSNPKKKKIFVNLV